MSFERPFSICEKFPDWGAIYIFQSLSPFKTFPAVTTFIWYQVRKTFIGGTNIKLWILKPLNFINRHCWYCDYREREKWAVQTLRSDKFSWKYFRGESVAPLNSLISAIFSSVSPTLFSLTMLLFITRLFSKRGQKNVKIFPIFLNFKENCALRRSAVSK